jgi:hypothetical protein
MRKVSYLISQHKSLDLTIRIDEEQRDMGIQI